MLWETLPPAGGTKPGLMIELHLEAGGGNAEEKKQLALDDAAAKQLSLDDAAACDERRAGHGQRPLS